MARVQDKKVHLRDKIIEHHGDVRRTAIALGVNYNTVQRWIKQDESLRELVFQSKLTAPRKNKYNHDSLPDDEIKHYLVKYEGNLSRVAREFDTSHSTISQRVYANPELLAIYQDFSAQDKDDLLGTADILAHGVIDDSGNYILSPSFPVLKYLLQVKHGLSEVTKTDNKDEIVIKFADYEDLG